MNANRNIKQVANKNNKRAVVLYLVKDTGRAVNNNKLPVSCRYVELKMESEFGLGGLL